MENGSQPATKQDIEDLRFGVDEKIEQLRSEMSHIHKDLSERFERTETSLLNAFYSFAQSNNKRVEQVEGNLSMGDESACDLGRPSA